MRQIGPLIPSPWLETFEHIGQRHLSMAVTPRARHSTVWKLTRFKKGDRVAIPFNHSCGRCEECQAGHQNVCLDLRFPMLHYTGGFGRYAKVAHADVNLVPLPASISYLEAGAMGCRFMTSWHGVVDRAKVRAGEWVAVFGCGGIGLAAVNIATALGVNVIAVSRTPANSRWPSSSAPSPS
jgi:D-arabinose 1-dehydrogenase-like Zn-dependent alcohol dehydrogenase